MENITYKGWEIEETPCYPCSFKIHCKAFQSDNATWRYCESVEAAKKKIDKRTQMV